MVFSFNFNVDKDETSQGGENDKNATDSHTIVWKEAEEIMISDEHFKRISVLESIENFPLIDLITASKEKSTKDESTKDKSTKEEDENTASENENPKRQLESLNYVNSQIVAIHLKSNGYTGDLNKALDDNNDLVPGVYEGGLKIWECSEDLVKYLHQNYSDRLAGKRVLEVGCGAGLPGVFAFAAGATVHFNDYNKDVLNEITIPNVLLNVNDDNLDATKITSTSEKYPETKFFAGDWEHLNTLLSKTEKEKYDLILTSETIYNPDNHLKLAKLIKDQLKSSEEGGVALIAAKTYYFGVGGGVQQFQKTLEDNGFSVQTVFKCESGVKRDILAATLT